MSVRIKVCGITNEADALAAIAAGADALGFITHAKSPRFIDLEKNSAWIRALPPLVTRVAVSVNAPLDDIRRWRALGLADAYQLHGDEPQAHVAALAPSRIIKALRPSSFIAGADLAKWGCDAYLLDTPGTNYGGTGRTCDWQVAAAIRADSPRPIILAGGLGPDNVAQAIAAVKPFAVDASSGLELSPGKKDHAKLRDYILAAKQAV